MQNQNQGMVTYDDEIDLRELFSVLWQGRWLISMISS